MQLPPYMKDASGFCYITTLELLEREELTSWFGRVGADGLAVPGTEPDPPWRGATVACIASGPSLTPKDCAAVAAARVRTITTNDSVKAAAFADIALAADHGWWQQHMHEMPPGPQKWTCSYAAYREFPQLSLFRTNLPTRNTGAKAIELAIHLGATRVILLGFDCSLKAGVHWHGPHERTSNPEASLMPEWAGHFELMARFAQERGVEVINCSRDTALTCFPRVALEEAL